MIYQLGRRFAAAAFFAVLAAALLIPGRAEAQSATIQIQVFKAGFVVGVSGGSGVVNMQNQAYPISIGGVSLGATIGASSADLVGEVYNLNSIYDIQGIYSAGTASYAVAGGNTATVLQNSRGVELHLRGTQVGLEFSVDLSGMSITLK